MMRKLRILKAVALVCLGMPALADTKAAVLKTYADIAEAKYTDSLTTAIMLHSAVEALIAAPYKLRTY